MNDKQQLAALGAEEPVKPSIEQLVRAYRNATDYAWRLRQQAEAATDAADVKLAELTEACTALGLVVAVMGDAPKAEEEWTIGDKCIATSSAGACMRAYIIDIDNRDCYRPYAVQQAEGACDRFWLGDIRRPTVEELACWPK